jgi:hypothetical protein
MNHALVDGKLPCGKDPDPTKPLIADDYGNTNLHCLKCARKVGDK